MPKRDGGQAMRAKAQYHDGTEVPPTLSDLGITKNDSSRWQKLAAIDEEKFEAAAKGLAGGSDDGGESHAAMHNAEGNHKHEMHQAMHGKSFVG